MRKIIFTVIVFVFCSIVSASNMQKVYTTRDDMYIQVDRLCRLAGVTGPSSFSPISARGLEIALNRIDPASLSEKEQKEYGRLKAELTGNYLFSSDGFDFNLNTGVNVGVNIADYSNFDFSNSDGIAPDRRNEALLQYRFEIPAIYIHPAFNFGDYVYMEANFALQNNNHHMYETTFGWLLTSYNGHLSVFGSEGPTNPPGELPLRAGLSIGNDNLSFIIGRYPHSVGNGITGNLVIGDNFIYQELTALSFMSRYFTYNISVTRFDQMETPNAGSTITDISRNEFTGPQQFRVVHRFDINIIDKVRIGLNLGTIYNSNFGFDIRFFYPFVLGHNYYNYDNSTIKRSFDEANNILSLSGEWAITKGLSFYGEVAIDQFQLPWEDSTTVPPAFGVLLNLKYSVQIGDGVLDSWIEGVYTNPFIYLNQKIDEDGIHDFNLDYIVGYEMSTLADYGYSGYQYGPDSFVLSFGSNYTSDNERWMVGGSLMYKLRGLKHLSHSYNGLYDTSIDMGNAVIGDDFAGISTPSGGLSSAEHMIQLKAYGNYLILDTGIQVYGPVGFNMYFNYCNQEGKNHFSPMGSLGFIWNI